MHYCLGDRVRFKYPHKNAVCEGYGTIVKFGPGTPVRLKDVTGEGPWVAGSGGKFWWLDNESQIVELVRAIAPACEPTEAAKRKAQPIATGALDYFPDALAAVSECSRVANEQHNPGQPMHWAYGKSMDHADCLTRHLADRGSVDTDGVSHTAKVAWRALALLQTELEKTNPELHAKRQAQREKAARGER